MTPKILTVDDSRTIRMIVRRAFKNYNCEILEASDGVEGLSAAQREKPDIILLDLTMPVMDGIEMLTRLKADLDTKQIPVIMLTAESGRENVVRIAKLGVRDYVVKPFKEEMIVERVGRVLDLQSTKQPARVRRFDDPLQILVVDDKPAILGQLLKGLGHTPWVLQGVGQVGEAVDFCSSSMPDLILVSLSLADGAGFMLYQMLRASLRTRHVPVLGMSVKTALDERTRAQQLGFNGVITKPIDMQDLQFKITRVLNLDTMFRYFELRNEELHLNLPADFTQPLLNEISLHMRTKIYHAVDAGLSRLVVNLKEVTRANMALIKFVLGVIQVCEELEISHSLVGSESVRAECKNYEESKNWEFIAVPEPAACAQE